MNERAAVRTPIEPAQRAKADPIAATAPAVRPVAAPSCLSASLASLGISRDSLDDVTLELLSREPTSSEMATRSKKLRWNKQDRRWHHADPVRLRWLAPPTAMEVGAAAYKKWGDAAGPIAGMAPKTLLKCIAESSDVLPMSLICLANAGQRFADALDPSGHGVAELGD